MNAIFDALEILNSVDVLYLEDRNVYRPVWQKNCNYVFYKKNLSFYI